MKDTPAHGTAAERRFVAAQEQLLRHHGVEATSRNLEIGPRSMRVHQLEAGAGEPVILLHGGGGIAAQWAPLMQPLQEHFHLIAPDRPGCGLSDKPDYRGVHFRDHAVEWVGAFLDELNLPKATLIGNSIGGFWSIAFALAHPGRVNRIVLIGAPAGMDRPLPLFPRLLGVRGLNRLLYSTVAKPSREGTRQLFDRILVNDVDAVPSEALECTYCAVNLPGADRSWLTMLENITTLRGWTKYYLRDELSGLRHPTLFVWGDNDQFAPPSSGVDACKFMPDARCDVVKSAGHLPWIDQPDACATSIIQFLSSLSETERSQAA